MFPYLSYLNRLGVAGERGFRRIGGVYNTVFRGIEGWGIIHSSHKMSRISDEQLVINHLNDPKWRSNYSGPPLRPKAADWSTTLIVEKNIYPCWSILMVTTSRVRTTTDVHCTILDGKCSKYLNTRVHFLVVKNGRLPSNKRFSLNHLFWGDT